MERERERERGRERCAAASRCASLRVDNMAFQGMAYMSWLSADVGKSGCRIRCNSGVAIAGGGCLSKVWHRCWCQQTTIYEDKHENWQLAFSGLQLTLCGFALQGWLCKRELYSRPTDRLQSDQIALKRCCRTQIWGASWHLLCGWSSTEQTSSGFIRSGRDSCNRGWSLLDIKRARSLTCKEPYTDISFNSDVAVWNHACKACGENMENMHTVWLSMYLALRG